MKHATPLLRSCAIPIVLEKPDGHAAAGIFYGYKKGFYSAYQYTIHIPCVDNTLPIVSGIDTAAECEAYFRHFVRTRVRHWKTYHIKIALT